jgi:type I restriction enzyme S subunit
VPYCEASEAEYEKFGVEYGDILIARMADPGHAAFIEEDVFAVFASYLIRFRPKIEGYDRYLQYWLRSQNYWDQANGAKTGTTRSSLNAQVLSKFKLVVPTQDLCEAFSYYVTPLRREITAKNAESRTLAETRDALLPKLVSGEVRVGEVDG